MRNYIKIPNKIGDEAVEKGSEGAGAVAGAGTGALIGAGLGAVTALATGGTAAPLIKEGAKSGADFGTNIGKTLGKTAGKTATEGVDIYKKIGKVAHDPISYLIDTSLKAIIDFVVPIPILGEYAGDFIAKYKGQILFAFFGIFIMMFSFIGGGITEAFSQDAQSYNSHISALPESLIEYKEEGIAPTDTPNKSPLGGNCKEFTTITSYFNDPNYYIKFGRWHKALDLVPSTTYYAKNKAYKLTSEIIVFSTMNGKTEFGIDKNGALIVKVINDSDTLEIGYAHLKTSFVKTGDYVNVGDPIGIMGNTGLSYGVHLHFWIATRVPNCASCWPEAIDPYPYIFGDCS